jgi:hypothetical protein
LKSVIVILLFIPLKSLCQSDSLYFKTNAEIGVLRYVIQTSSDTLTWSRLDTISPKKNTVNEYKYPLTQKNIYYRIKAVMTQGNYFTFALAYFNKPPTLNIYPNTFNKTLN